MSTHSNRIDRNIKPVVDLLERICAKGYSPNNVFDDWLDLIIHAFCRQEDEYLAIIKKYRNTGEIGQREADYFAQALGALMHQMQQDNEELLGELYQQWNISHHRAGQYFTPVSLVTMMAQMLNDEESTDQVVEPRNVSDPACGAGIMFIGMAKTMSLEQVKQTTFIGQDIDLTCVKMTALNLMFFNLNGIVVWGDSLAATCNKAYQTTRSWMGGSIRQCTDDEVAILRERMYPKRVEPEHRPLAAKPAPALPVRYVVPEPEPEEVQLTMF